MFLERVTSAGKTSELAMYTPVIETNGEAKIVPHIIPEKLRSTKNKINLHQPPIIAARTSPTVSHIRHVHMGIEKEKPPFQNEVNQGVSSFIPVSNTARTNEFHMVRLLRLANASIESPPAKGIHPSRPAVPKKKCKIVYTYG